MRYVRLDCCEREEDRVVQITRLACCSAVRVGVSCVAELEALLDLGMDLETGLGVCDTMVVLDRQLDPLSEAFSDVAGAAETLALANARRQVSLLRLISFTSCLNCLSFIL